MGVEGYIPGGPTGNTLSPYMHWYILFTKDIWNYSVTFRYCIEKGLVHSKYKNELNICSSKEHLCGLRWKVHFFVLFIYSLSPSFWLLHLIHYPEKSKWDFSDQCSTVGDRCNQRLWAYCITKCWDLVTDQIKPVRGKCHRSTFKVHCLLLELNLAICHGRKLFILWYLLCPFKQSHVKKTQVHEKTVCRLSVKRLSWFYLTCTVEKIFLSRNQKIF